MGYDYHTKGTQQHYCQHRKGSKQKTNKQINRQKQERNENKNKKTYPTQNKIKVNNDRVLLT